MDSSVIGEGMSILHSVFSYHFPYALWSRLHSVHTESFWYDYNSFQTTFVIEKKATEIPSTYTFMVGLVDDIWGLWVHDQWLKIFFFKFGLKGKHYKTTLDQTPWGFYSKNDIGFVVGRYFIWLSDQWFLAYASLCRGCITFVCCWSISTSS